MRYVGIDLHKERITVCVVDQDRNVRQTRKFPCADPARIEAFFAALGPFEAVVEATASYEWLLGRIEPLARRVVLAHPGKLRVIAESTRKSDKLDARVLAEFLALDMNPQAYRPTPRQREHRALVRHRQFLMKERTQVRVKVRRILSDSNADRRDLFARGGRDHIAAVPLSDSDRFIVDQMLIQLSSFEAQLAELRTRLRQFATAASAAEQRHRQVLQSVTGVGEVTTEVVLAELGDIRRFRSAKQVVAYAGLAPGRRESAGKVRELGITKQGSPLLRWVLVEAAWQAVRRSAYWRGIYRALKQRRGARRAIVAVARRLLEVLVALLRSG
ncbi:IS110 family transposase [Tautonia rosea]|uniref:IS110 family transposase n=1 Tax=Tautonia rosea TaxID=2728037 RepID=UPI001473BFA6|nr:IS110 family transposase [Tautonia rosea]